jgi:hypothetical protein
MKTIEKHPSSSINHKLEQHPYNFYRCQSPDAPLRPAPNISARYNPIYTGYREMLFASTDYKIKRSAEEFKPHAELLDRWADAEWEGDYTGDTLATWMKSTPNNEGRALFNQALENGIASVTDAPQIMKEFFQQVDATPRLFDMEKVQKGADVLADLSPIMHYLANTSLMWTSTTLGPVSRMVGATGRFLDVANSLSRFVETSSYVVGDVSSADVFQRDSHSLKTGVNVRLMHSLIRNQVIKSTDEDVIDFENRGHPISMRIGANGGMMFSLYCIWYSASLGRKYSREDYENCAELARCISYINGIDYKWLPKDYDECCLYIDHSLAMCEGQTVYTEGLNKAFYSGIPQLLAERQSSKIMSKLMAVTTPISQSFLLGINQWSYGEEIFEGMPGMPKRAAWPKYLFMLVKFMRPKVLTLDKMIPGYETRVIKRRVKHREFTNKKFVSLVAKLMKRSDSTEVKMTYDSHDHSSEKDLKSARN